LSLTVQNPGIQVLGKQNKYFIVVAALLFVVSFSYRDDLIKTDDDLVVHLVLLNQIPQTAIFQATRHRNGPMAGIWELLVLQ
jgi:hypothetical protein